MSALSRAEEKILFCRIFLSFLGLSAIVLAGCGPREELLDGDRFDPREVAAATQAAAEAAEAGRPPTPGEPQPKRIPTRGYTVSGEAQAISLPGQRSNADWTHRAGTPAHQITNPALGNNLTQIWSRPIGQAGVRRLRITADPVIAGGRIFTLDAAGTVSATATSGAAIWSKSLVPPNERAGEGSGGGLAVAGQTLYVTTGYGNLHALDVTSGAQRWEQSLGALASGAPTVAGDLVYLTTRNGFGWAIETGTGRIRWQIEGTPTVAVTQPGAAPAVGSRSVYFPFGSGEVTAVLRQGGLRIWATTVSGERTGRAYATVPDISGDPVILGDVVYVGNAGGRTVALDAVSGARIWTALEGSTGPVWPAGGSVFLISDQGELVRLSGSDGTVIWNAELPYFQAERVRRRKGVYAHFGPILAGSRLIVASSDGFLREVDPASGQLLRQTPIGGAATVNPVVAGGTLYIVTEDGQLRAFR
ncbi:MAG: PQQ-binding-like beta-propeller repeat protein [Pseudomonadota bacterium]